MIYENTNCRFLCIFNTLNKTHLISAAFLESFHWNNCYLNFVYCHNESRNLTSEWKKFEVSLYLFDEFYVVFVVVVFDLVIRHVIFVYYNVSMFSLQNT